MGTALVGWGSSRREIQRLLQCARCADLSAGGDFQYTCATGHVICDSCGSQMASCCYQDPSSGSLCRQIIARLKITFSQKKMIEICKSLTSTLPKVVEVNKKENDPEPEIPVLPVESIKSYEKDEDEGSKDDVGCQNKSENSASLPQTLKQGVGLADIIPRPLYPGENPESASHWDEMHEESGITAPQMDQEDHKDDSSHSSSVSTCDSSPEEKQLGVPVPTETELAKDESSNPDSLDYEENTIRLDIKHLEHQLEFLGGWSSADEKKEMDKVKYINT